jgi:hypothetical protein
MVIGLRGSGGAQRAHSQRGGHHRRGRGFLQSHPVVITRPET